MLQHIELFQPSFSPFMCSFRRCFQFNATFRCMRSPPPLLYFISPCHPLLLLSSLFYVVHPSCILQRSTNRIFVYGIVSDKTQVTEHLQEYYYICGRGTIHKYAKSESKHTVNIHIPFQEVEGGVSSTKDAFQLPPHQRRMRSPPHS